MHIAANRRLWLGVGWSSEEVSLVVQVVQKVFHSVVTEDIFQSICQPVEQGRAGAQQEWQNLSMKHIPSQNKPWSGQSSGCTGTKRKALFRSTLHRRAFWPCRAIKRTASSMVAHRSENFALLKKSVTDELACAERCMMGRKPPVYLGTALGPEPRMSGRGGSLKGPSSLPSDTSFWIASAVRERP